MSTATKTRAAKSVPTKAPTAETLLCQVRADLGIVERKLINAHNAAEAGSTLDTLLEHIAYQLLPSAVKGLLGDNPTKDDAERAYVALFVPIALLECLLLSADGTILEGAIRDAFETLDRIDNQLDSSGELARSLPELDASSAFNRGRDIAINMLAEADTLFDEREAFRWMRDGKAQDNFFKGYLTDILTDRSLLDGFTSIVSATLRNDQMDLAQLKQVTLAETQAGDVGADKTEPGPDASANKPPAPPKPPKKVTEDGNKMEPLEEALAHYAHALAVVKLLGHDQQRSDLVPAAYNLMLHDYDAFMESFGCGVDALNDVSADLSVVLGLLAAAAHDLAGDNDEDSCMWGAHELAEMSKRKLDECIAAIEFGGAST